MTLARTISRRQALASFAAAGAVAWLGRGFPAAHARAKPQRIVCLGGELTEIVHALGAGERVVGRDATSYYPDAVNRLPDVGYLRALGAEGVLSLSPDLIIASASAGPPETLRQIESASVRLVRMPEVYSPEAVIDKIRAVAEAVGENEAGERLAGETGRALDAAQSEIGAMPGEPGVLFLLNARDGAPMAAGRKVAADAMIGLARARNVFSAHEGYKPISLEAAVAAAPEAIVMMSRTLEAMGGVEAVASHPALKLTPAAASRRIIARDSLFLLGFGPRLPAAMVDLARALRDKAG